MKFLAHLCNLKCHYRSHKDSSLDLTMRQSNPAQVTTPNLFRIHINMLLLSTSRSVMWFLSFSFPQQNIVYGSPHFTCVLWPAYLVLLGLMTLHFMEVTVYESLHHFAVSSVLLEFLTSRSKYIPQLPVLRYFQRVKIYVFYNVTLCSPVDVYRRFEGVSYPRSCYSS